MTRALTLALVSLLAASTGCTASMSRKAAASAVTGATQSTLRNLEDPATRERFAALVETPEAQRAIRQLAAAIADGAVDELSAEDRAARTARLAGTITDGVLQALAGRARELGPSAGALTRRVVDEAMEEAARQLPATMAPAMRRALTEELGPGLADVLRSPDVRGALTETASDVARQAVIGSQEGLTHISEKQKREGTAGPLALLFARSTWLIALGALILVVIPVGWLLVDRRRLQKYRVDAERRTARADALLSTVAPAPSEGVSPDVLEDIRRQLHS